MMVCGATLQNTSVCVSHTPVDDQADLESQPLFSLPPDHYVTVQSDIKDLIQMDYRHWMHQSFKAQEQQAESEIKSFIAEAPAGFFISLDSHFGALPPLVQGLIEKSIGTQNISQYKLMIERTALSNGQTAVQLILKENATPDSPLKTPEGGGKKSISNKPSWGQRAGNMASTGVLVVGSVAIFVVVDKVISHFELPIATDFTFKTATNWLATDTLARHVFKSPLNYQAMPYFFLAYDASSRGLDQVNEVINSFLPGDYLKRGSIGNSLGSLGVSWVAMHQGAALVRNGMPRAVGLIQQEGVLAVVSNASASLSARMVAGAHIGMVAWGAKQIADVSSEALTDMTVEIQTSGIPTREKTGQLLDHQAYKSWTAQLSGVSKALYGAEIYFSRSEQQKFQAYRNRYVQDIVDQNKRFATHVNAWLFEAALASLQQKGSLNWTGIQQYVWDRYQASVPAEFYEQIKANRFISPEAYEITQLVNSSGRFVNESEVKKHILVQLKKMIQVNKQFLGHRAVELHAATINEQGGLDIFNNDELTLEAQKGIKQFVEGRFYQGSQGWVSEASYLKHQNTGLKLLEEWLNKQDPQVEITSEEKAQLQRLKEYYPFLGFFNTYGIKIVNP